MAETGVQFSFSLLILSVYLNDAKLSRFYLALKYSRISGKKSFSVTGTPTKSEKRY